MVRAAAKYTPRTEVYCPGPGKIGVVKSIYGGAAGYQYVIEFEKGNVLTIAETLIEPKEKAIERAKLSGRINIYRATKETLLELIKRTAPSLPNGGEIVRDSERLVNFILQAREESFANQQDFEGRLQIMHDSAIWDAISPQLDFAQLDSPLATEPIQREPELEKAGQPEVPPIQAEGTSDALELINTAVAWQELLPLPGIGEVAARKIFEKRPEDGYQDFTEIAGAIHDPEQPRQFIRLDWKEVATWENPDLD